jgi:hypothetical protein
VFLKELNELGYKVLNTVLENMSENISTPYVEITHKNQIIDCSYILYVILKLSWEKVAIIHASI